MIKHMPTRNNVMPESETEHVLERGECEEVCFKKPAWWCTMTLPYTIPNKSYKIVYYSSKPTQGHCHLSMTQLLRAIVTSLTCHLPCLSICSHCCHFICNRLPIFWTISRFWVENTTIRLASLLPKTSIPGVSQGVHTCRSIIIIIIFIVCGKADLLVLEFILELILGSLPQICRGLRWMTFFGWAMLSAFLGQEQKENCKILFRQPTTCNMM